MQPDVTAFPSYIKEALILALEYHERSRSGSMEEALISLSRRHTGDEWGAIKFLIQWNALRRTNDRFKALKLTSDGVVWARQLRD